MKNWVCDGLDFFQAPWAVYLPCAIYRGRRASRCGRSGGPASRLFSEAVDDKAQVCVVCFGFMEHATPSWALPKLNEEIERKSS